MDKNQLKEPSLIEGNGRTGVEHVYFKISRWIAFVLLVTAILKIIYAIRIPVASIRPDVVVNLFTNREVLLLAGLFEAVIATLLIKSHSVRSSAALILYFSACASAYQLGLIFQGNLPCSCLGVATDWLGAGTTTVVSRLMLVGMWIFGVVLLAYTHRSQRRHGAPLSSVACLPFLVLLFLLETSRESPAAPIAAEGELTWIARTTNVTSRAFRVVFDTDTLKLVSLNPNAGPKGGDCTEISFIDKKVVADVLQCGGSDRQRRFVGVSLNSAEGTWALGNCPDSLTSWVFLTLRCSELFPTGQATRRLASPSTTVGEPLSVLTEASYEFSRQTDREELTCDLLVRDTLRKGWTESPFVTPEKLDRTELEQEKRNLAQYADGFVLERMSFSRFTNVAGFRFPMLAESTLYAPQRTNVATSGKASQPVATVKLVLTNITYPTEETFALLPLKGPMTVGDGRLRDQKLHLYGCHYQTNQLTSFEITAGARSAFAVEVQKAREKMRAEQIKRLFTAILAALVVGIPGAIFLLQRWKGERGKSKTNKPTTETLI